MNILPGEPVPPGFEDEVNRVAEIQQAIDKYKGNALVGLEYTVELYEEDREPGYICLLCEKRGDPRTIMQHWTSFNHRIKYLEKHFPTAVREFNPVKYKPNSHSIMISIVQRLAEAIEDHHGRLTLSVCNVEEFRRDRNRIQNEILDKFHIDERNGPNFLNIIDRSLWETKKSTPVVEKTLQITIKAPVKRPIEEAPANRDGLDEISSDEEDTGKKSKIREQSPAYRMLPRVRRSPPFEEEREKKNEKALPTPKELSLQASHIAQERYKWEKYRCMLEIQLKQMEKTQKDYEKNPEKHPMYPDEWKKFWNRRYKELQAEKKIDPNKYDYKPEWILFWTKRMQDLFNEEVDVKKKEIKIKLGLPENAEEKVDQLKEKYKVQVNRSTSGSAANHSNERSNNKNSATKARSPALAVIDISDDESIESNQGKSGRRSRSHRSRSMSPRSRRHEAAKRSRHRSQSRSRSPHPEEYDDRRHVRHRENYERHVHGVSSAMRSYPGGDYYGRSRYPPSSHYPTSSLSYRVMDSHQYPKYEHSQSPSLAKEDAAAKPDPEPEDEGPLTVVAVLRLLTALEEHLGSLGPKVVDMLGKALALEKVKANSADDMLLNDDNCVFFETIKEKLKGLLIADVLDDSQKVKAVKRAVKNIAAIVHQVNEKGTESKSSGDKTNDANADGATANKKVKNPAPTVKDLPFDRQVVSTKLAAALVIQGREDISTEEMDKLIYIFILMTKLSKEKLEVDNTPMYCKDMLPELGITVAKPITIQAVVPPSTVPPIVDDYLEDEVNALVQEVEDEMSNEGTEKNSKNDSANTSMLESLTDSDLQTLLQNFKHLSTEEQHHLIAHLKKLENANPVRVEKLRKFVNLADISESASTSAAAGVAKSKNNEDSSTSSNLRSAKRYNDSPMQDQSNDNVRYSSDDISDRRGRGVSVTNPNKFSLDDEDEDDDYNFEDVFKAASSNVKNLSEEHSRQSKSDSKSMASNVSNGDALMASSTSNIPKNSSSSNALTFNPAGLNISLSDTQNLIANLMGSLQQSNSNSALKSISPKSQLKQQQLQQHQQPHQRQQQQQQNLAPNNIPFFSQQQQSQPQSYQDFNQMGNMGNAHGGQTSYYNNSMPGNYNNAGGGGGGGPGGYQGGYQQWGNPQQMPQYGMQNFMNPQQQQQQQQQQQMAYNMYGRGSN